MIFAIKTHRIVERQYFIEAGSADQARALWIQKRKRREETASDQWFKSELLSEEIDTVLSETGEVSPRPDAEEPKIIVAEFYDGTSHAYPYETSTFDFLADLINCEKVQRLKVVGAHSISNHGAIVR